MEQELQSLKWNLWPGNVERAQDLWLDRAPPLRILDLGSGAGYFLYVSKYFGHEVLGFDTDHEPLFGATTELLRVSRVIGRIERQTPLPDFGKRFDLITAHRICFHRIGKVRENREWSPADWKFSLREKEKTNGATEETLPKLWKRVEQLEKTCRNSDPTELAAPACSAAAAHG